MVGTAEFLKLTPSKKAAVFKVYDTGEEVCLPVSQILSTLPRPGEVLELEITEWIAEQKGLGGGAGGGETTQERQTGTQRTAARHTEESAQAYLALRKTMGDLERALNGMNAGLIEAAKGLKVISAVLLELDEDAAKKVKGHVKGIVDALRIEAPAAEGAAEEAPAADVDEEDIPF